MVSCEYYLTDLLYRQPDTGTAIDVIAVVGENRGPGTVADSTASPS